MRQQVGSRADAGFTLVEVLVSAALLATLAAGASYLVARAVEDGETVRLRTVAAVAALQKMEQLRSLAWGDEPDLQADLSLETPATGGPGLQASPGGTLDGDTAQWVDYLNADGEWLEPSAAPHAVFARRWAVELYEGDPAVLRLRVVVTRARGPHSRTPLRAGWHDVELVSIRARHQP